MKGFIAILIFLLLVLGYLFLNKKDANVITEAEIQKIEEEKAKEPTAEELIDAQFGIREEDAEARYAPFIPQN
jgi:regulatory protein YycI of two-component signal transduction system YycFG